MAVSDINIGRSGPHLIVEGLWSAAVDGTELHWLLGEGARVAGWISSTHILVYKWEKTCSKYDLSVVDIRTGELTLIWRGVFEYVAADPETGMVIVGSNYSVEETNFDDHCPVTHEPGLYQLSGLGGSFVRLGDWSMLADHLPSYFYWLSEWKAFVVKLDGKIQYISPSGGDIRFENPPVRPPLISPSGDLFLEFRNNQGAVIRSESREDIIIPGAFCNALWGEKDDTLFLIDDDMLYIVQAPDFTARSIYSESFPYLCDSDLRLVQP